MLSAVIGLTVLLWYDPLSTIPALLVGWLVILLGMRRSAVAAPEASEHAMEREWYQDEGGEA